MSLNLLEKKIAESLFDQVKAYFLNEDLQHETSNSDDLQLFYHSMALILLANSDYRIVVKVHCNKSDVRSLAPVAMSNLGAQTAENIDDYIRELANLLGGSLKRRLESAGIHCGLSLPLLTRGFDELFSTTPADAFRFFIFVKSKEIKISVQIQIDFLTENAKKEILKISLDDPNSSSGTMEFL